MNDAQAVRAALLRQWQRIEASLVDLDAPLEWLDQATGRASPAEVFEDLLPLMT